MFPKNEVRNMEDNIRKELIKQAKKYKDGEFNLFTAELGWEDWMNEYTKAEDGEPASEAECKVIDEILQDIWEEAHPEDDEI